MCVRLVPPSPTYRSLTFDPFHPSANPRPAAESEKEEEDDVEEEEEARYELVNKETHSDYLTASDSDGGRDVCEAELSDPDGEKVEKGEQEEVEDEDEEGDAAEGEREENFQRALIEDIRSVLLAPALLQVHEDRRITT